MSMVMWTAASPSHQQAKALDSRLGAERIVIPFRVVVVLSVALFIVPSKHAAALSPFQKIHRHAHAARRGTTSASSTSTTQQPDALVVREPVAAAAAAAAAAADSHLRSPSLMHASPKNCAARPSRRHWMRQTAVAWMTAPLLLVAPTIPGSVEAAAAEEEIVEEKDPVPPPAAVVLTDEQLRQIVISDVIDRQFLVTGNLTPAAYLPSATFTDEIDTYGYQQWREGTQKLFVSEGSSVRLVGDVQVTPQAVEFRFDEDLMFRIPFRPVVSLTGKVVLTRDPSTGKIASYREFWDQDVATVLKSAKVKLF